METQTVYETFSARTTLAVSGGSTDLADFLAFDSPETSKINAPVDRPIRWLSIWIDRSKKRVDFKNARQKINFLVQRSFLSDSIVSGREIFFPDTSSSGLNNALANIAKIFSAREFHFFKIDRKFFLVH